MHANTAQKVRKALLNAGSPKRTCKKYQVKKTVRKGVSRALNFVRWTSCNQLFDHWFDWWTERGTRNTFPLCVNSVSDVMTNLWVSNHISAADTLHNHIRYEHIVCTKICDLQVTHADIITRVRCFWLFADSQAWRTWFVQAIHSKGIVQLYITYIYNATHLTTRGLN